MGSSRLAGTLASGMIVAALLCPAAVRAQDRAAALDPPAPAAMEPPGSRVDEVALSAPPVAHDRSGWGTFGGHAGFFAGTAVTAGLVAAGLSNPSIQPYVGALGLTTTAGLTVLGAWAATAAAASGDWDRWTGWGLAGLFPGMAAGLVGAAGLLMAADANAGLGTQLATLVTGATVGGAAGYLGFRAMAEGRGNAGWEVFAFWVGFFVTEVIALASVIAPDATDGERGAALAAIPVGAALSATVVHLLLR